MVVGVRPLEGLRDVRDPAGARLQKRRDTCGLYAAASVLGDFERLGVTPQLRGVRGRIRANRVAGRIGLDSFELANLLERNLPDEAAVLIERDVTEDRILDFLGRGQVVSYVDGSHWVRVLAASDDGGPTWVRVYDPARGYYEQRLSSFMTRFGPDNQMIWIRV